MTMEQKPVTNICPSVRNTSSEVPDRIVNRTHAWALPRVIRTTYIALSLSKIGNSKQHCARPYTMQVTRIHRIILVTVVTYRVVSSALFTMVTRRALATVHVTSLNQLQKNNQGRRSRKVI
jgi:hypothetical protein